MSIPLASGESNYGKYEFKELIESQALDFVQPDICFCGGVLTMKKIAAMAEAQYMLVAPHNPMSPLATAINVHFAASTPNFHILEYSGAGFRGAQGRAEGAADGAQGRLHRHPEQARLGRGIQRRGIQEHAAGAVEAGHELPRGRIAVLPIGDYRPVSQRCA